MDTSRTLLLGAFALAATAAQAHSGPTAICNPLPQQSSVSLRLAVTENDPRVQNMIGAVENPSFNPPLLERMGRPTKATMTQANGNVLVLDYPVIQDPAEMAERFKADAEIAAPFGTIGANGVFCDGVPTPAPTQTIVEYYNSQLNHFYLSSLQAEMDWLDGGGGGGGWVRTGESWTTHVPSAPNCAAPRYDPVYVFQGTPGVGPNSHYFTANPEECGWLRTSQPAWSFLAIPFGASRVTTQGCTLDAPVGLFVLYNNRAAQNDSNHRYTSKIAIYEAMMAQGWIGYGIQLCVKSEGPL